MGRTCREHLTTYVLAGVVDYYSICTCYCCCWGKGKGSERERLHNEPNVRKKIRVIWQSYILWSIPSVAIALVGKSPVPTCHGSPGEHLAFWKEWMLLWSPDRLHSGAQQRSLRHFLYTVLTARIYLTNWLPAVNWSSQTYSVCHEYQNSVDLRVQIFFFLSFFPQCTYHKNFQFFFGICQVIDFWGGSTPHKYQNLTLRPSAGPLLVGSGTSHRSSHRVGSG